MILIQKTKSNGMLGTVYYTARNGVLKKKEKKKLKLSYLKTRTERSEKNPNA